MKSLPNVPNQSRLRTVAVVSSVAMLALLVAGVSFAAPASKTGVAAAQSARSSVVVKTRRISGLGTVLVNAKGRTLYIFAPDKHRRATCTGSCASFWPPMKQKGIRKAKAGGTAKASLIGSDRYPGGGRIVTYAKWPLYTYVGDHAAGTAKGQGLNASGGLWYVMSPTGKVIKKH